MTEPVPPIVWPDTAVERMPPVPTVSAASAVRVIGDAASSASWSELIVVADDIVADVFIRTLSVEVHVPGLLFTVELYASTLPEKPLVVAKSLPTVAQPPRSCST